jgi:surface antigen
MTLLDFTGLASNRSIKKLFLLAAVTVVIIVALPIGVVLALSNLPLLASFSPANGGPLNDQTIYTGSLIPGDGYDYGYCTYWVALRRIQIGDPIPNDWGDAINWNTHAMADGYIVNHTPAYGAIFQWPLAPGGEGHVAFVESVDSSTGDWTVSEMNAAGWDVVDKRTYPSEAANDYNFIHDKIPGSSNFPTL